MLRLTLVFAVWIASTAHALDEWRPDPDAELHEAYAGAWSSADEDRRRLLDRAQHAWYLYRAAHCSLRGGSLLGDECAAHMARERAAELRRIGGLTDTNVRTIFGAHDGAGDQGRADEGGDPR